MKTKTSSITDSMNRSSRHGGTVAILLIPLAFALAWFALSRAAQAVDPPPDGGYANENTAEGSLALFSLTTTGFGNTAIGSQALEFNTTGGGNTATGDYALFHNTTASYNTAAGYLALFSNTTGGSNTATGQNALFHNTTGDDNTATGAFALYTNTTGGNNTAIGGNALQSNTIDAFNSATGFDALNSNTTGSENTANGEGALASNTTGFNNTATGFVALAGNTTSSNNTATGSLALPSNTTGNSNTAIGASALFSNTSGGSNIAIGQSAGFNLTTGSNNIDIGNRAVAGESNTIRVGKSGTQTATFIAGISGTTVAGGVGVLIGSNGRLGTINSSARYKENIQPMDKASEAILSLQPVTFRYKKELDAEGIPQFGLVAEEVEKINPDLVACDEQGKPYTVRHEAVNAMLLNEFLKEHRKNEQQEARIGEQQKEIEALKAALKEQAAQIQKVSEQLAAASASGGGLETTKRAPQVVFNNR